MTGLIDAPTPEGVSYKTPKALAESPAQQVIELSDMEGLEIEEQDLRESSDDDEDLDINALSQGRLALRWQGYSRTDLQEMWGTALRCRDTGDIAHAETVFSRAVTGLSHVMGKTNADTIKAAYHLADIHAKSGRMEHATDLLEKVTNDHLELYGRMDTRTQRSVLHAVELLNGWNREADASGLLSLSKELLESSPSTLAGRKGKASQKSIKDDGSDSDMAEATRSVLEDMSPTRVDYGLGVARTHVAMKDRATENLLRAIIQSGLAIRIMIGRTTLYLIGRVFL